MTVISVGWVMAIDDESRRRGRETQALHLVNTECVLPVRDMRHAKSAEVLDFCVAELKAGTTYNELRLKLGCGPASTDRKWRRIREILVEFVLPDSEEELLKFEAGQATYLLQKMHKFLKKAEARTVAMAGDKNEHQYWKNELDAMSQIMEHHHKRTDHFLKMKDIQKKEKSKRGTTIIFQNEFKVARPGDTVDVTPANAAQLKGIVERE